MDNEILGTLKLIVNIELEEAVSDDKQLCECRCHEVARALAQHLKSFGLNAEVKDGVAVYDIPFFLQNCSLLDERFPRTKKALLEKKTMNVLHSWCEIAWDQGGTVIVDFLPKFPLGHLGMSLCHNLIVGYKEKLPHGYCSTAIHVGRWIIFRTMPPHLVRVRSLKKVNSKTFFFIRAIYE